MSDKATVVTGVEMRGDGGWYPFVERHDPCVDPYATDHSACTIVQSLSGPRCESEEEAERLASNANVETEGGAIIDWERTGS